MGEDPLHLRLVQAIRPESSAVGEFEWPAKIGADIFQKFMVDHEERSSTSTAKCFVPERTATGNHGPGFVQFRVVGEQRGAGSETPGGTCHLVNIATGLLPPLTTNF